MLGKLMKYEWKSTRRIFPLIYLVVLVFAVLSGLSMRKGFLGGAEYGGIDNGRAMLLFFVVYAILVVALAIVTVVVIIHRFYRSMLSQEGYLSHTLPVKKWQQIVSKLLMSLIWMVLAAVVIILSLAIIIGFSLEFSAVFENFNLKMLFQTIGYSRTEIAVIIVLFVLSIIRSILQFYAAMAIGGSANSHKVAYSFLTFVVIVICANVISAIAGIGALNKVTMTAYEYTTALPSVSALWGPNIVFELCTSVVLFLITEYFLRKKLNLE